MRAAKGETRARIWPAAAALLLALLAGSWTPAAASIPSPIDPLATPPPATRLYAQALAAGAEPEPAATADELPQLAAEPPPATSTAGADFSLLDRTPCPERQLEQLAPPRASDDAASYPETRVWGFHLAERTCAWSPGNVSQSRQEGYGKASSETAVGPLEFGYQGMPRDPETGLIYFRNRYYDPELGRFITADPKGYVDGPSMYVFESDDPANGSDPMGLEVGQCYEQDQSRCKTPPLTEGEKSAGGFVKQGAKDLALLPVAPFIRAYQDTKESIGSIRRVWSAYRAGGLGAAIAQGDKEGEAQNERAKDSLPIWGTIRQGSRVISTYETQGSEAGGAQVERFTFSLMSDIALAYGVVRGAQSRLFPSTEELSEAAAQPNRNNLTDAGRALQKHSDRPGSAYTASSKKAAVLNQEGQALVDEILTAPGAKKSWRTILDNGQRTKVIEVISHDGRGIRFDAAGKRFLGFREPPKEP